MASALVLCAGFGTRLLPLTNELPKPLVPVGDRSVLAHIAATLAAHGFAEMVVNTHHNSEKFSSYYRELPVVVQVVHEAKILGTAGAVRNARQALGEQACVVWNGDILADPPLAELVAATQSSGIALAVAPREAGSGTVGLGSTGEVVRIRGQSFGEEVSGGDYIGVCALASAVAAQLPGEGCLVGDCVLPALRAGQRVETRRCDSKWWDIGSLCGYIQGNCDWLEARDRRFWVHPSASISPRVRLHRSVVGAGAMIDGEGDVSECVIWPGARTTAPLTRAVVTRAGQVVNV